MSRIVNLDLDLLRAFVTIAETRSFTRAAERLGRTQSAVNLQDRLAQGALDLALVKREPLGPDLGVRVWREPLVWAAADREVLERDPVLALAAAPAPDVYRRRALTALEAQRRPYRITFTSPSLAGLHAAIRAGLGVTVLPRDMAPPDLVQLGPETGLPPLPDAEIALVKARGAVPRAAELLGEHILAALDRRRPAGAG